MTILVTGASGYVGAAIYQHMKQTRTVVGTYKEQQLFPELVPLEITDRKQVLACIERQRPTIIIHAAANPSIPWCESNPERAKEINDFGTQYVVEGANRVGAKVIFISSYAYSQPSVYGRTKAASEGHTRTTTNGWVIIRPAHIIGRSPNTTNDREFNRFLRNIVEGTPAIYDTSKRLQPTWLAHLTEVIAIVVNGNITNQVIPVAVPEVVTRYSIAKDVLEEFGVTVTPTDKHDTTTPFIESLVALEELHLPQYTYTDLVEGVKREIRTYLGDRKNSF